MLGVQVDCADAFGANVRPQFSRLFPCLCRPLAPPADSVDYEGQIKKLQTSISNWEKLRGDVEGGVHEISAKLDSIPDRVGNTFLTLWSHVRCLTSTFNKP